MTSYLLILGHRDAIRWVLAEQRMAFPSTPRAEVRALAAGDRLYLYATRGSWNHPSRDRGRIIATARTETAVVMFDSPLEIGGRSFVSGCRLSIDGLIPYPGGLELQPLVNRLEAFPKPDAWSAYLRRALLRLTDADVDLLDSALRPMLAASAESVIATYVANDRRRSGRQ